MPCSSTPPRIFPRRRTADDTYTPTGGHLPVMVREDLFRIDHNFNDKWQLFGHYIHDAMDTVEATPEWQGDNYPTIGSNFSNPAYAAAIKLTGTLTPDVLVEAAFNYNGNKIAIIPVATVAPALSSPRAGAPGPTSRRPTMWAIVCPTSTPWTARLARPGVLETIPGPMAPRILPRYSACR
jgi:hypothetical protein